MTNGKNYLYWPYTIILAYMIILISKTDNPTRLFHSARLFGIAEYYFCKLWNVKSSKEIERKLTGTFFPFWFRMKTFWSQWSIEISHCFRLVNMADDIVKQARRRFDPIYMVGHAKENSS